MLQDAKCGAGHEIGRVKNQPFHHPFAFCPGVKPAQKEGLSQTGMWILLMINLQPLSLAFDKFLQPQALHAFWSFLVVSAVNADRNDLVVAAVRDSFQHIINRDVALSYQLLKLANSPLFRRRRPIAAMQDAMVILGLDSVKKWATLLMLSRFASGKPSELLRTALVRAYMCSSLAANGVSAGDHTFFTTGLLSVLDALLDRPMARVLSDLALVPDVTDALLGDACGPVGRVLRQVQAYEAGDWSQAMASNDSDSLRAAYLEAVSSADRVLAQVL